MQYRKNGVRDSFYPLSVGSWERPRNTVDRVTDILFECGYEYVIFNICLIYYIVGMEAYSIFLPKIVMFFCQ